jgi:Ni,Fe-hydrogenase III small subunit/formate hydrogenlyase subunit 6/NADH:ubiquinone oxidoreductase subunit I
MIKAIFTRVKQGYRTTSYPRGKLPVLPDRYRGSPVAEEGSCPAACRACVEACPTGAISRSSDGGLSFDLGKCLFCEDCERACPQSAMGHSREFRLATSSREGLVVPASGRLAALATPMERKMRAILGRSLKLRVVSAGGCNGCECDVNVLGTIGWDLGRFGIQFVASPRHADGLVVTGPVTKNMELALRKTWEAIPEPKIAIAVGSCAISGGPYAGCGEAGVGADSIIPIDLYIPGCPPHPYTTLDGLLRLVGRIAKPRQA